MNNIWVVGSAAVIASVAANLIIRAIAVPALDISSEFEPMQMPRIAFFTVIGTGAGVVAFHFIRQRASRSARTFLIVAVAALAGSYLPNLFLLVRRDAGNVPRDNEFGGWGADAHAFSCGGNHSGDSGVVGTPRQQMNFGDAERRRRMHQAEVCTCQE